VHVSDMLIILTTGAICCDSAKHWEADRRVERVAG